jgi:hypothetical protein
MYMVEGGKVIIDKTENVRNCATLCELLDFPVSKNLRVKIRRDIKFYAAKWKNRNQQQANAFLIMAMAKIEGKVSQTLVDICDDLYKNLDGMDAQFQLGETLIALHQVCPRIKELAHWQKWMEKRLEGLMGGVDNIFEYNWQAKFLFEIRKDIPAKRHAEELLRRLIGLKITADIETNYLAVYFEAAMSLWGILGGDMLANILPVWIFLLRRWKGGLFSIKNGVFKTQEIKNSKSFYLFYFKNRTARIDITGHVINGLQVTKEKSKE